MDAEKHEAAARSPSRRARANRSRRPGRAPLNPRQQKYLDIFYELDQQAQREQNRRWHQHLRRDPADQWRWIPYDTGHPDTGPTPAQQLLAQRGIQDVGAGSTLAALTRRGLIETRRITVESPTGLATQLQIRLTRAGRSAARAARQATSDHEDSQLPAWLDQALETIAQGHPEGAPKTKIGRVAAGLLGPKGHSYIDEDSAWAYRLTDAGHAYLARRTGESTPPSTG